MPATKSVPQLQYSADQLREFASKQISYDDLRKIGVSNFKPWVDEYKNGESKENIGNRLRRYGYSKLFDDLKAEGLEVKVNSPDGNRHVFHWAIWQMIADAEQKSDASKKDAAQRKHLGETALIDVDRYIDTAIRLLKSSNGVEIALGIMACTGRRGVEVAVCGEFSPENQTDNVYLNSVDTEYLYTFKNPAKKHNNEDPLEDRPQFVTTSLVKASDLLKAYSLMRKSPEFKELSKELKSYKDELQKHDRFNDLWESKLSNAMEDYFSFLPGKLQDSGSRKRSTPHDLRNAYAHLSCKRELEYNEIGDVVKGSEILFKAIILGHYIEGDQKSETLRNLKSTLSYYGYQASKKPSYPETVFSSKVRIRCYEPDRERINAINVEQADAIRYLLNRCESLEAENLKLRDELREANQKLSKPTPEPVEQPVEPAEPNAEMMAMLKEMRAEIEALKQPVEPAESVAISEPTPQPAATPKLVEQPSEPAESESSPKLTDRQVKAFQWLDTVAGVIKDHNLKHDGDIWQMWAYSPRLLKDVSKVSQSLVSEFWVENEAELLALNEQWGLDDQHNRRRGMKKNKPVNDFNLERPVEMGGRKS